MNNSPNHSALAYHEVHREKERAKCLFVSIDILEDLIVFLWWSPILAPCLLSSKPKTFDHFPMLPHTTGRLPSNAFLKSLRLEWLHLWDQTPHSYPMNGWSSISRKVATRLPLPWRWFLNYWMLMVPIIYSFPIPVTLPQVTISIIKKEASKVERLDADPPKQGTDQWDQMRRRRYEDHYLLALVV